MNKKKIGEIGRKKKKEKVKRKKKEIKREKLTSLSEPGSIGSEGVLCITQSSSITGASPSDGLILYARHLLGKSYPSAEMQSTYSAAPADWA